MGRRFVNIFLPPFFPAVCAAVVIFVSIMQDGRRRSLYINFLSLGFIQVANFLLSLLVIPYLIRIVGSDGFGVIAVAQVLMFYLSVATDYGFNRTAIRDIALFKDNPQKISRVFFTVLTAKILICIAAFLLLLFLVAVIPLFRQHSMLYLLAFSFVVGQVALVNWFFQGMEKMHFMAILSLLARLLFVALVFLFLKTKDDAPLYVFFMGAGNFIAGLVGIYTAVRMYNLKFIRPSRTDIVYELKEGWHITVTNLSTTTIQYIGIFILRIFTTDTVVGYYGIAERIYFAMKLMIDIFFQGAFPRVCRLMLEGTSVATRFLRKTYIPFLAMVILGCAVIFLLSSQIIAFFMGHPYEHSAFLLRVFCGATIIVCLNIPPCLILLAGNHKKNYLRVFTIGTVINIVSNLVFAPLFGASGTVLSVMITESIITAGLYLEVYRIYRVKQQFVNSK